MASSELTQIISILENRNPSLPLAEGREWLDHFIGDFPLPDGIQVFNELIAGVPCERLVPIGLKDNDLQILYFHGGGYIRGSLYSHRPCVGYLAKTANLPVLNVGYRLAPEFPFPAQVEDALAVYQELLSKETDTRKQIILVGDSAGGGLVLALCLKIKELGLRMPVALCLSSPWTDMTLSGDSLASRKEMDPWIKPDLLPPLIGAVLQGYEPSDILASPVFADFHGFPPTLIHVGERETLFDDSFRLFKRMKPAGVEVEFEEWPGLIHAFHLLSGILPEARLGIEKMAKFIRTFN